MGRRFRHTYIDTYGLAFARMRVHSIKLSYTRFHALTNARHTHARTHIHTHTHARNNEGSSLLVRALNLLNHHLALGLSSGEPRLVNLVSPFLLSLSLSLGLPRSLEAAVQRYGQATFKASCATQMEPANGKPGVTLTYGKLYSRSLKIAFSLLHKVRLESTAERSNCSREGLQFLTDSESLSCQ